MNKLKPSIAKLLFPDYKEYANIHKSGSLEGMNKQYGWKKDYCFQIGNYIYYLYGHPTINKSGQPRL